MLHREGAERASAIQGARRRRLEGAEGRHAAELVDAARRRGAPLVAARLHLEEAS